MDRYQCYACHLGINIKHAAVGALDLINSNTRSIRLKGGCTQFNPVSQSFCANASTPAQFGSKKKLLKRLHTLFASVANLSQ